MKLIIYLNFHVEILTDSTDIGLQFPEFCSYVYTDKVRYMITMFLKSRSKLKMARAHCTIPSQRPQDNDGPMPHVSDSQIG